MMDERHELQALLAAHDLGVVAGAAQSRSRVPIFIRFREPFHDDRTFAVEAARIVRVEDVVDADGRARLEHG